MANYYKDVAKMLGVKLGEEFLILSDLPWTSFSYWRITQEKGLENKAFDMKTWPGKSYPDTLHSLLLGKYVIDSIRWKPKKGEYFYTPDLLNNSSEPHILEIEWSGSKHDQQMYENGLVFKEKAVARYAYKKIIDIIKSMRGLQFS